MSWGTFGVHAEVCSYHVKEEWSKAWDIIL